MSRYDEGQDHANRDAGPVLAGRVLHLKDKITRVNQQIQAPNEIGEQMKAFEDGHCASNQGSGSQPPPLCLCLQAGPQTSQVYCDAVALSEGASGRLRSVTELKPGKLN
jgi:hypothetical protein